MKNKLINAVIIAILFVGNRIIINYHYYFIIIYTSIIIYHIYTFYFLIEKGILYKTDIKYFLFISILLYIITYFIICDPNPIISFLIYYTFNPCFIKAVLIIFIHTSFLSKYIQYYKNRFINLDSKSYLTIKFQWISDSYFLSDFIRNIKNRFSYSFFNNVYLHI